MCLEIGLWNGQAIKQLRSLGRSSQCALPCWERSGWFPWESQDSQPWIWIFFVFCFLCTNKLLNYYTVQLDTKGDVKWDCLWGDPIKMLGEWALWKLKLCSLLLSITKLPSSNPFFKGKGAPSVYVQQNRVSLIIQLALGICWGSSLRGTLGHIWEVLELPHPVASVELLIFNGSIRKYLFNKLMALASASLPCCTNEMGLKTMMPRYGILLPICDFVFGDALNLNQYIVEYIGRVVNTFWSFWFHASILQSSFSLRLGLASRARRRVFECGKCDQMQDLMPGTGQVSLGFP